MLDRLSAARAGARGRAGVAVATEVLAGGEAADAARRPWTSDRRRAAAALVGLVIVAVGLRLVPTVLEPSLNWWDEVFQAIEPAHRVVYGYGLVAWEFQLGMRSWLLPGAVAALMELSRLVGDGPGCYLPAIAVGCGLLASGSVVCCFLWGYRWFGLSGAIVAGFALAVAPELVYFGGRTLAEVVAAHLLVIAFYLVEPGYRVASRRRIVAAGMLFGIVCLLRIQMAPAVGVVALWSAGREWRCRLPALIAGGLAALALGGVLDWLTLGYPLASVLRNLLYNFLLGVSADFAVEPWYYYLAGELGVWLSALPLLVILVAIGARRLPVLLVAAIVVVAVHSAIGHKEYRFIYPALLLFMMLAAIGLAELAERGGQWLGRRGWRTGRARAVCAILLAAGWAALSFGVWSGGALAGLRQRDHDQLLAMSFVRHLPAPCGIGLYGEHAWAHFGGYTYLHRPIPMFWPEDAAALAALV
jgi:phosphatidylinositol glycan class B